MSEPTQWGEGEPPPPQPTPARPPTRSDRITRAPGPPPQDVTRATNVPGAPAAPAGDVTFMADAAPLEATAPRRLPSGTHATSGPTQRGGRGPAPGATWGAYDVYKELGRGGMGAVFLARDRATGRDVALKVLLDLRVGGTARERFHREGQVAGALEHPGIVRVFGAGDVDGVPFLACELVEGARDLLTAARELPLPDRARLVRDAARALAHAHERGVVHRDVKPDNLLVGADGRVRVADFGLAAARGQERLTLSGVVMGTPAYMAPEQVDAERAKLGPHTDVWALGVVLHEALTGQRPFSGSGVHDLYKKILLEPPAGLRASNPDASPALEAVCARALAKEPAGRYPHAGAMADDLDRALAGESTEAGAAAGARRRRRALLAASLVALALTGGAVGLRAAMNAGGGRGASPPRLELRAPRDGQVTNDARVAVRGRVQDDDPWVDVRVGGATTRVAPGTPFTLEVDLSPGENRLVVEAVDASGDRGVVVPLLVRRAAREPAWWTELGRDQRPPLPLPDGVTFGERRGEYVNQGDGSVLVWVPPGTFTMGSARDDAFVAGDAEGIGGARRREVTLTRGFFLGKLEVTFAQYERFCAATGHPPPSRPLHARIVPEGQYDRLVKGEGTTFTPSDEHPVWDVNWDDAQAYCAWAGLRLPTEAEWEWAARGPQGRRFPWGDEVPTAALANMGGDERTPFTVPVGSYPQNVSPFGCLDMAGNVCEWVQDWLSPYPAEPGVDPAGPATSDPAADHKKVFRGGHWAMAYPDAHSTTFRSGAAHWNRDVQHGFRVCRSPDAR